MIIKTYTGKKQTSRPHYCYPPSSLFQHSLPSCIPAVFLSTNTSTFESTVSCFPTSYQKIFLFLDFDFFFLTWSQQYMANPVAMHFFSEFSQKYSFPRYSHELLPSHGPRFTGIRLLSFSLFKTTSTPRWFKGIIFVSSNCSSQAFF